MRLNFFTLAVSSAILGIAEVEAIKLHQEHSPKFLEIQEALRQGRLAQMESECYDACVNDDSAYTDDLAETEIGCEGANDDDHEMDIELAE